MRDLTELQNLAQEAGLSTVGTREEIMDRLREATGTFDPSMQIDPMKAKDLKNEIDWTAAGDARFAKIGQYLTSRYVLEPKLDGARLRLFLGSKGNSMNTGRRSDLTFAYIDRSDNFPHMRDAVLPELAGTILDGELMPPSKSIKTMSGVVTHGTLNSAVALVNVNPADAVRTQELNGWAYLVVFDVIAFQGESVKHLPLIERRLLLEKVVDQLHAICPQIQIISQFEASVENIEKCLDEEFEGAMIKNKTSHYIADSDSRSGGWYKVKTMSTADAFIIGSVNGKGRNEGKVGSLRVAVVKEGATAKTDDGVVLNHTLYIADVGGFTDAFRAELTGPNGKVAGKFIGAVIEFMGQGVTKNFRVRHPHFVRLRLDKALADCGVDQLDVFPEV